MIKKSLFKLAILFLVALIAVETKAATPTMRLDYYHSGNASQEMFSLDRLVIEPLPWPGNPQKNIDETNLGKYLFEVRDRATNRLLYSRGFASIYGEWETTDEAKSMNRTFSESLRFPAPQVPAQIVLKKRDASRNRFFSRLATPHATGATSWSRSRSRIQRSRKSSTGTLFLSKSIARNGPMSTAST